MDRAEVPSKVGAICFCYAGSLESRKNGMLWPHQTRMEWKGETVSYFVAPQDGDRATNIHLHEFLHSLGLPDQRDPEPAHCIMSCGHETLPLCPACRFLLGWIRPNLVSSENAVPVRIGAAEGTGECLLVEVSPGGLESLFVELRGGTLDLWGLTGREARHICSVDGKSCDRVTPYSVPGFSGKAIGSRPVFLTEVRMEGKEGFFRVSPREPLTDLEWFDLAQSVRSSAELQARSGVR